MSTKVVLAGLEVAQHYECMKALKAKSALATFWFIRKKPDYIKKIKEESPDMSIFIDSGAFTFFDKEVESESYYQRYMEEYAKFLYKYAPYVHAAAELDLDSLIGEKLPNKWRHNEFKDINKNVPIIYIWHPSIHDLSIWIEMCQKHEYVGIASEYKAEKYHHLLNISRAYLSRVHAFGFTRSTDLPEYDLYSVDSSTYLMGAKFGSTMIFDSKTINRYEKDRKIDIRNRYRSKFTAAGLDFKKIEEEDYYEVLKMNMLAFIEMEAHLAVANRNKAYWKYRLPKPSIVRDAKEEEIDKYLTTQSWSEEWLKSIPYDDKLDRCYAFSLLQWGQFNRFKEWISELPPEDAQEVLGDDLFGCIANPRTPEDVELDQMRKMYNLSLLKVPEAKKRTSLDHFIPIKKLKKRVDNIDNGGYFDTENLELF